MINRKVLYFFHLDTSFIKIDKQILGKRFIITPFVFNIQSVFSIPILWLKQIFFIIKNHSKTDLVFCMFAGYHSFIPTLYSKLLKKPCIIVAGGIDSVSFPSVKYGNFNKKVLGKITELSFKWCSYITPISEYLINSEYSYQPNDYARQGFLHHSKKINTPVTVVYNGFVIENWFYNHELRRKNSFLTIASNLDSSSRLKIKGVDLIIEVAKLLPKCSFTIIGRESNANLLNAPSNVKIVPFVEYEKLRSFYCEHEYYLQLSMSEGFGNTLAESMLCECVPIGANAGAIPMIIANTGFILEKKDPEMLKSLIEKAMHCDKEKLGKAARQRIIDNFSIERREKELLEVIDSLLKK